MTIGHATRCAYCGRGHGVLERHGDVDLHPGCKSDWDLEQKRQRGLAGDTQPIDLPPDRKPKGTAH